MQLARFEHLLQTAWRGHRKNFDNSALISSGHCRCVSRPDFLVVRTSNVLSMEKLPLLVHGSRSQITASRTTWEWNSGYSRSVPFHLLCPPQSRRYLTDGIRVETSLLSQLRQMRLEPDCYGLPQCDGERVIENLHLTRHLRPLFVPRMDRGYRTLRVIGSWLEGVPRSRRLRFGLRCRFCRLTARPLFGDQDAPPQWTKSDLIEA